jgi:hypothetical protein
MHSLPFPLSPLTCAPPVRSLRATATCTSNVVRALVTLVWNSCCTLASLSTLPHTSWRKRSQMPNRGGMVYISLHEAAFYLASAAPGNRTEAASRKRVGGQNGGLRYLSHLIGWYEDRTLVKNLCLVCEWLHGPIITSCI